VLNTGRVSAAHFQDLANSDSNSVTKAAQWSEKLLPNVLQGAKGTTVAYDSTTNRFWYELTMKVGKENCHALAAMIPPENGWVQINLYSAEEDFNFWNPVFHKIGTAAELSPSLAYQPRWTDDSRITSILEGAQGTNWGKAIAYGIMVAIIASIGEFFRRRRAQ
jgi:hypothetical protein